jgi:hypothetical protein
VAESRHSTVPHTAVQQINISAETAFLFHLKKVSFKTEGAKSKWDHRVTWNELHINTLFFSYNLGPRNIISYMTDENDNFYKERREYFAKSFMQHICLTERFYSMEIVT